MGALVGAADVAGHLADLAVGGGGKLAWDCAAVRCPAYRWGLIDAKQAIEFLRRIGLGDRSRTVPRFTPPSLRILPLDVRFGCSQDNPLTPSVRRSRFPASSAPRPGLDSAQNRPAAA